MNSAPLRLGDGAPLSTCGQAPHTELVVRDAPGHTPNLGVASDQLTLKLAKRRRNICMAEISLAQTAIGMLGLSMLQALQSRSRVPHLAGAGASLVAGGGLDLYRRTLPKLTTIPRWSPNFCAYSKWWAAASWGVVYAAGIYVGDDSGAVKLAGPFAGAFLGLGLVMTGVGIRKKRQAASAADVTSAVV